jgi:hypothetical protein
VWELRLFVVLGLLDLASVVECFHFFVHIVLLRNLSSKLKSQIISTILCRPLLLLINELMHLSFFPTKYFIISIKLTIHSTAADGKQASSCSTCDTYQYPASCPLYCWWTSGICYFSTRSACSGSGLLGLTFSSVLWDL